MSMNNFLEQLEGLGRFGADAYQSGLLAKEQREQIRRKIFSVKDYSSAKEARELIETYIHDYGGPREIPDDFFDELDDTLDFIYSLEKLSKKQEFLEVDGEKLDISELIAVHCNEFRRVASKILRLAFVEKEPPMILPRAEHFRSQKQDPVEKIFGE